MISLPSSVRVFLHTPPTDLRKGFDALCGLVTTAFGQDPTSGHLFLFVNRRRDRIKILYWDRDGLAIWYKRLESQARFSSLRLRPRGLYRDDADPVVTDPLRHRPEIGTATQTLSAAHAGSRKIDQCPLVISYDCAIIRRMITQQSWPTDPRECHDLLSQCSAGRGPPGRPTEDLRAALDQAAKLHDQTVQEQQQTIDELRHQIDLYRRYVFGPRRERLVEAPGQGHLFELDETERLPAAAARAACRRFQGTSQKRGSRKLDYDRLPKERIEHDVPEAEKVCSCCGEHKARIGEDEARVLHFVPAHFELHIHILPKYACSHCRDGVVAPEPPPRPISGCIAGPGLLSELIVSKFVEHLTLYRFEDICTRYGLYLSRSTLCDWVAKVAGLLTPLYDLQKQLVLSADVLWTDDTPVRFLGGATPGSHLGRFWPYIGPALFPYDVYDFTENRKRDGPAKFPEGLRGIPARRCLQWI